MKLLLYINMLTIVTIIQNGSIPQCWWAPERSEVASLHSPVAGLAMKHEDSGGFLPRQNTNVYV